MDFIYTALLDRFEANKELFTSNGLKPIKTIDRFKGQYINKELFDPYYCPAIFYQYQVAWEGRGQGEQKGTCRITLHVELENLYQSHNKSTTAHRSRALEDFTYYKLINIVVHGFSTDCFSKLIRVANDPDLSPTSTNVELITYTTEIIDESMAEFANYDLVEIDDLSLTEKAPDAPGEIPDGYYQI